MSDVMVDVFSLDSKKRRHTAFKNVRRFSSYKRKSRNSHFENKPLIGTETDSNSEEEITLHDIRHLKRHPDVTCESSTSKLRKLKKNDTNFNGTLSGSKSTTDPFQHCEFIQLKLEEGDTLQSISIKYQCAMADIKRANNLISNQDFYALQYLRIPVKKFSLLTEILPVVEHPKSNCMTFEVPDNVRTINIGIGQSGRSPSPQEAAAFFKRMDEDLVKIMLGTNSQKESLEAAAAALTTPQIQPLIKDPYNTVDCGIQWNYLILFVIIVALVIPTIVALYIYLRPLHEHHNYNPSGSSNNSFSSVPKLSIKRKS